MKSHLRIADNLYLYFSETSARTIEFGPIGKFLCNCSVYLQDDYFHSMIQFIIKDFSSQK